MNAKLQLQATLAKHIEQKTGHTPNETVLNGYMADLVSFFELLAQADQKERKFNDSANNRNSDHPH